MRKENDDQFTTRLAHELDRANRHLPDPVLSRLRDARRQAVAEAKRSAGRPMFIPRWLTAGGLATAAILVVAVSFWYVPHRQSPPGVPVEYLDQLAAKEHQEMIEDLDFYRWLSETQDEK